MKLTRFALSLAVLIAICPVLVADVIDDFSSYSGSLNDGEFSPTGLYQWSVINRVPSHNPTSLDINSSGLKLAGYFHEPHSGYAGSAEAVFSGFNPVVGQFGLEFDVAERHDKLELDINVVGKSSAVFLFSGVGRALIEFTDTEVREYLNGNFVQSRSYASLGWDVIDEIRSFTFKGIHHDNGNSFVYVGNMRITGIPEPGSASLFAMLLLGLLAPNRRRTAFVV